MGEISGTNIDTHQTQATADTLITGEPGKIETGIEDVFADGEKQGIPVFNVSHKEFYSNMEHGRKRLRLKNGSPGQRFMSKSKTNQPFWMSYTNSDTGETWTRKVR